MLYLPKLLMRFWAKKKRPGIKFLGPLLLRYSILYFLDFVFYGSDTAVHSGDRQAQGFRYLHTGFSARTEVKDGLLLIGEITIPAVSLTIR